VGAPHHGGDVVDSPALARSLPALNEMNAYFWTSGREGRLKILRCQACGLYIHPYAALCPKCRSSELEPEPVSGRGVVVSFTVNHQPWFPHVPVPYVIALVELEEQSSIRLVTNLLTVPVESVRVGMRVEVYFEAHGEVFIPLFRPVQDAPND
jgi:uncharacterized OB-fold protein